MATACCHCCCLTDWTRCKKSKYSSLLLLLSLLLLVLLLLNIKNNNDNQNNCLAVKEKRVLGFLWLIFLSSFHLIRISTTETKKTTNTNKNKDETEPAVFFCPFFPFLFFLTVKILCTAVSMDTVAFWALLWWDVKWLCLRIRIISKNVNKYTWD